MKIGVIGIGNIGGTLARKLSAAGHEVRVANSKGRESVLAFAKEIGAKAEDTKGAVEGADLVILSIPFPAITSLPKDIFDGLPGHAPIIDTGNYYPGMRDPQITAIDQGQSESVWVSEQLGRPVIKAFNNILAYSLASLGSPEGAADRLAVAVAGDNAAAKKIVMGLVNELGFDPVDAGSLEESWRQQPCTPVYCCDWNAEQTLEALSLAVKGQATQTRDRLWDQLMALGLNPAHAQIVASNRKANAPA
jgi:predicted dinucleotide-binding enzyme